MNECIRGRLRPALTSQPSKGQKVVPVHIISHAIKKNFNSYIFEFDDQVLKCSILFKILNNG
jgi:hypothetical protein